MEKLRAFKTGNILKRGGEIGQLWKQRNENGDLMNFMAKLRIGFLYCTGSSSQNTAFSYWHSLLPSSISLNLVNFLMPFSNLFILLYISFIHTPPLAKKHSAIYIYFSIILSNNLINFC